VRDPQLWFDFVATLLFGALDPTTRTCSTRCGLTDAGC
jgi:hypothetical protein